MSSIEKIWSRVLDCNVNSLYEVTEMVLKDFTTQIELLQPSGISYNGSEEKRGVVFNGENWLNKEQKHNWNNVLSEYIASSVIRCLGGNSHITKLMQNGNKLVVACKDFTSVTGDYSTLGTVGESSIDTDTSNHEYFIEDIIYELQCLLKGANTEVVSQFMRMCVYDTILANPDRHKYNLGFYRTTGIWKLTPIYDNGASLLPRASFENHTKDWWRERIYVFPNSKIMFNKEKRRSNYYEVWSSDYLPKPIVDWARNICIEDALVWIDSNPLLSHEMKRFYSMLISMRFRCIIRLEDFDNVYKETCRRYY